MYTNIQRDEYSAKMFADYLDQSKNQTFILDLSNASLMEVIDQLILMKSKISPNYGRGYVCLKNNIKLLEREFNCTLQPCQITDVFWHHFVPFLLQRGLALSSIKTMCSQLRTTLEWASKHQAKISPTFDLI